MKMRSLAGSMTSVSVKDKKEGMATTAVAIVMTEETEVEAATGVKIGAMIDIAMIGLATVTMVGKGETKAGQTIGEVETTVMRDGTNLAENECVRQRSLFTLY